MGLQIQVLNAGTSGEINAAFATLVSDRAERSWSAPMLFFTRRVQLAAGDAPRNSAIYIVREYVEAGGLMSYGTSLRKPSAGRLVRGPHPQGGEASGPAGQQSTKFELVINLETARALGLMCRRRCSPAPTR